MVYLSGLELILQEVQCSSVIFVKYFCKSFLLSLINFIFNYHLLLLKATERGSTDVSLAPQIREVPGSIPGPAVLSGVCTVSHHTLMPDWFPKGHPPPGSVVERVPDLGW